MKTIAREAATRTRLWLVRHGETEWNVEGRLQGSSDSPLTSLGRRQSEAVRHALARVPFAAAYTSDLGRARETALLIASARGLPLRLEPRLRELVYGTIEGLTWSEIEGQHPELHAELRHPRPEFVPPGGESRIDLQRRMVSALDEISRAHAGESVLVVTHGNALAAFLRHVLNIPLELRSSFRAENCAIHRFEHTGDRFHLVSWGAADHLEDL